MTGTGMSFAELRDKFRFLSAGSLLAMPGLVRCQELAASHRQTPLETPLLIVFVSHRWQSPTHPDLNGRHHRAICAVLDKLCDAVESFLLSRRERLSLLPELHFEGVAQATELARRLLGFGPFAIPAAVSAVADAPELIRAEWQRSRNRQAFRSWLQARIGVWIDYCCMPQAPFTGAEAKEFRTALASLGDLVESVTLLALRDANDDYPQRGWCAAEYFLGSHRSFASGLFVDVARLEQQTTLDLPPIPTVNRPEDQLLEDSYQQDRVDFDQACERWRTTEGPLIDGIPPAVWAPFRWMAGTGSRSIEINPFGRLLQALMNLAVELIRTWLMSPRRNELDLCERVTREMLAHGLACKDLRDLTYIGLLAASRSHVEAFRPLFQAALAQYPSYRVGDGWTGHVELLPLPEGVRALFSGLTPRSAGVWHSRLATDGPGGGSEVSVVQELKAQLREHPPEFRLY